MSAKTFHITHLTPIALARLNALLVGTLGFVTVIMRIISFTYLYYVVGGYKVTYLQTLGAMVLDGIILIATSLIVGFIIGLVVSIVYNLWAKKVGGIKIDLEELN